MQNANGNADSRASKCKNAYGNADSRMKLKKKKKLLEVLVVAWQQQNTKK